MQTLKNTHDHEQGMAIVVGLILIAIISFAAFMSITNANTDIRITENKMKSEAAFNAAEAGLEHARFELGSRMLASTNAWNTALEEEGNLLTEALDESAYSVTVGNNSYDPSGSDTQDLDNVLVVTSRGDFRDSNKEVQAHMQFIGNVHEYAQELRDSANTSNVSEEINPVTHSIRLQVDAAAD
ncbi:hypothetical protein ACFL4G_08390 [Thermodesulfobacteriota bacterium]